MRYAGPKEIFGTIFYNVILLIFLGPWPKVSWGFVRKISASLSKLDSQFQWKLSGETFCKTYKVLFFLNIERKTFGWLSERRSAGFQADFYLSMGTNWKKINLKSFCIFCGVFRVISGNWAGKVWPACQNCILCIYKIILKKKLFWKTNENFYPFQTLSRSFQHLLYFFGLFVKIAFYVSIGTL